MDDALARLTWQPIDENTPKDRPILFYAPAREGLSALQGAMQWHPDAGFCVDELRTATHWREYLPPPPAPQDGKDAGEDADMFWPEGDPENPCEPEEYADQSGEKSLIFEMQRAKRLPNRWYSAKWDDELLGWQIAMHANMEEAEAALLPTPPTEAGEPAQQPAVPSGAKPLTAAEVDELRQRWAGANKHDKAVRLLATLDETQQELQKQRDGYAFMKPRWLGQVEAAEARVQRLEEAGDLAERQLSNVYRLHKYEGVRMAAEKLRAALAADQKKED